MDEEKIQLLPGTSSMKEPSGVIENHGNLKSRRRNNVVETLASYDKIDEDNKATVTLPDIMKVWQNGVLPRIPGQENEASPSKVTSYSYPDERASKSSDSDEVYNNREKMKIGVIKGTMSKKDFTFGQLRLLGCTSEGFVTDEIRRILWPRLLGTSEEEMAVVNDLELVHTKIPDEIYQQLLKDVARSGSHICPDSTEKDSQEFHDDMMKIMCWVLHRHPHLNYYQGYNDVAATVLMVMGLQRGLHVLEKLTLTFLERFMERTMETVNQELFYIFALLERVHPTLLEHLENVELFPHFALAEYTTWYAHKYAERRKLLHRLFDYFMGSPPLIPLYLSTVIVAYRADEIFGTTPDMGHTHKVLCTLPEDLPFENLLLEATRLYRQYPPESISNDVVDYDHKRRRKEQEWKTKAEASRLERDRQKQLRVALPQPRVSYRYKNYKTITVVTIIAIGLYAFLKSSGLN